MTRRITWLLTSLLSLVIIFPSIVGYAASETPLVEPASHFW